MKYREYDEYIQLNLIVMNIWKFSAATTQETRTNIAQIYQTDFAYILTKRTYRLLTSAVNLVMRLMLMQKQIVHVTQCTRICLLVLRFCCTPLDIWSRLHTVHTYTRVHKQTHSRIHTFVRSSIYSIIYTHTCTVQGNEAVNVFMKRNANCIEYFQHKLPTSRLCIQCCKQEHAEILSVL